MSSALPTYGSHFVRAHWPSPNVLGLSLCRSPVNAFSSPFWKSLAAHFVAIRTDPRVRVVILASDTKAFTAGLDLKQDGLTCNVGSDPARSALLLRAHVLEFQGAVSTIEQCERPVIAAIHGSCYGLGIDIIAACDIRICDSETQFSIKEVDVGIAADVGTLQRLPKKSGNDSLLRELAFTARTFRWAEACELGLISRAQVVQGGAPAVWSEALRLAKVIAEKSPVAVLGTKCLLNYSADHSVADGLNHTAVWSASALQSEDIQAVIQAANSRDRPTKLLTFKPLSKL